MQNLGCSERVSGRRLIHTLANVHTILICNQTHVTSYTQVTRELQGCAFHRSYKQVQCIQVTSKCITHKLQVSTLHTSYKHVCQYYSCMQHWYGAGANTLQCKLTQYIADVLQTNSKRVHKSHIRFVVLSNVTDYKQFTHTTHTYSHLIWCTTLKCSVPCLTSHARKSFLEIASMH